MSDLSIPGLDVWPTRPLGEVCDIVIGRTPSRNRPELWGGDRPWLSIADMNQGRRIRTTKEKITSLGAAQSRSRLISAGTVLLSFKLSIGKVAVADIDTYTNEAIAALPILDFEKLSRDFLYWTLRSIRLDEEVDVAAKGKTLNSKKLARLQIPLPPLDEQKRIAVVLDKADVLRLWRQESLRLTETFLQSVFIDMFGDPMTNPMAWPMLELGRLGIVQTGNTPPRSNKANYSAAGIEWIKTDNIVEDRVVVTTSAERLSESGAKAARVAPAGSLLVACIAGSEKSIGRAALTDREVAFNQQINAITPHVDTSSLFLYFLIKLARRQIQMAAAKGMKNIINKSTFESLRFIAPGYDEQIRFAFIAERLIAQKQDCQDQSLDLDAFFSSLQQRAFRGDLDLSQLNLEEEVEPSKETADKPHQIVHVALPKALGTKHAKRAFVAPSEIEPELKAQDSSVEKGDPIPWSEDYFQYRILGRVLEPPYSFTEIFGKRRTAHAGNGLRCFQRPNLRVYRRRDPSAAIRQEPAVLGVLSCAGMKLLRFKLGVRFRSLPADFELHFLRGWDQQSCFEFSPYCLVGCNGTGKSNILEALAAIFYHIECIYLDYRPDGFAAAEDADDTDDGVSVPPGFSARHYTPDVFQLEYFLPNDALKRLEPRPNSHDRPYVQIGDLQGCTPATRDSLAKPR